MRSFLTVLFLILATAVTAVAQDRSVVLSGNLTKFSIDVVDNADEYAQGFGLQGSFRFLGARGKASGLRARVVADFQRNNTEVFHDYMTPMGPIDIYRDVNTYSAGAGLGYKVGPVEPFANYLLGAEKRHEMFNYELARTVQAGARLYLGPVVLEPFRIQFKGNGTKPLQLFGYSVGAGLTF